MNIALTYDLQPVRMMVTMTATAHPAYPDSICHILRPTGQLYGPGG